MRCLCIVFMLLLFNPGYSFPDSLDISSFNDRFHHYFTSLKLEQGKMAENEYLQLRQEVIESAPDALKDQIQFEFTAIYLYHASKNSKTRNDSIQNELLNFQIRCQEKGYKELIALASYFQGQLYWLKLKRADQAIVYYDEAYRIV